MTKKRVWLAVLAALALIGVLIGLGQGSANAQPTSAKVSVSLPRVPSADQMSLRGLRMDPAPLAWNLWNPASWTGTVVTCRKSSDILTGLANIRIRNDGAVNVYVMARVGFFYGATERVYGIKIYTLTGSGTHADANWISPGLSGQWYVESTHNTATGDDNGVFGTAPMGCKITHVWYQVKTANN
jgi:hypothetical protein